MNKTIKVEEAEYYTFLNMVENFLTAEDSKEEKTKEFLLRYIRQKKELREWMQVRDSSYAFYCKTKERYPAQAKEIYQKYKTAITEIEKIKKEGGEY